MRICSFPECGVLAAHSCECCKESRWFCSDHGDVGGDREGDESRLAEYYPNQCFACGGFNADAE